MPHFFVVYNYKMARSRKSNSRSAKRKTRRSKSSSRKTSKNVTLADLLSTTPMALRVANDPFAIPNKKVLTYENIPYNNTSIKPWSVANNNLQSVIITNPLRQYFGNNTIGPSSSPTGGPTGWSPGGPPGGPSSGYNNGPTDGSHYNSYGSFDSHHSTDSNHSTDNNNKPSPVHSADQKISASPVKNNDQSTDADMQAQLAKALEGINNKMGDLEKRTNEALAPSSQTGGNNSLLEKMLQIAGSLWN